MKKSLLIILITWLPFFAFGQGNFSSANGLFEVDYLKGCAGTTITLTPTGPTGTYFPCFDADLSDLSSTENTNCFNEQANKAEKLQFTYTEAGVYDILLLLQLGNSQLFDSLTIEILDPELPTLALANCNGEIAFDLDSQQESFDVYSLDFGDGSPAQEFLIGDFPVTHTYPDNTQTYTIQAQARLDSTGFNNCGNDTFTRNIVPENLEENAAEIEALNIQSASAFDISYAANENQFYRLEIKENEGSYTEVAFLANESAGTYTFNNLDLVSNYYCVKITTTSLCTGEVLSSNEVCTIKLSGNAQQDGNLLNWNSNLFANSILLKNGLEIYSGSAPFLDSNVLCGQNDIYQVVATDSTGIEVTSLPLELTAQASATQTTISQIATRVLSSTALEIAWEFPQDLQQQSFTVYKRRNLEEDFFIIGTSASTSLIDTTTNLSQNIFYYAVAFTDACGNSSRTASIAPNIKLSASQADNDINFTWNEFTGYDTLLSHYVFQKYDADMALIDEWNVGKQTLFTDNVADAQQQKYFYRVEAVSENDLISYSNLLEYKIPSTFFVPTGFTPNGDARNEILKVVGKFIDQVEFSIYNRWGTLLFRSTDLDKGWDGYYQDKEAPAGSYTYTVLVKDRFGEEYFKSGVFNLIR